MYLVDRWGGTTPDEIRAQGADGVLCYLSPTDGQPGSKDATPDQVKAYRDAGLIVGLNWESTGTTPLGGYQAGVADATQALALARERGYPTGCAIYFSCDWDVQQAQLAAIFDYFDGARSVLDPAGYLTGIYGGYSPVDTTVGGGHAHSGWQTEAWSSGMVSHHACLLQDTFGGSYDHDEMLTADPPLWGVHQPHNQPPEETPVQRVKFTTGPCAADGHCYSTGALNFPKGTNHVIGVFAFAGRHDKPPAAVKVGICYGDNPSEFYVRVDGGEKGTVYTGYATCAQTPD